MINADDKIESLWHAVIRQAISDASRVDDCTATVARLKDKLSQATEELEIKRISNLVEINKRELAACWDAWNWLYEPNEDFDEVCAMLNIEPIRIRQMADGMLSSCKPRGRMMLERATELF